MLFMSIWREQKSTPCYGRSESTHGNHSKNATALCLMHLHALIAWACCSWRVRAANFARYKTTADMMHLFSWCMHARDMHR
jgi:hypothetical protein